MPCRQILIQIQQKIEYKNKYKCCSRVFVIDFDLVFLQSKAF